MGVSDTTWIAGLLVIALFVSAIGTFTAVSKVTGFASDQEGTTNATVSSTAVIEMVVAGINFGDMAVGSSDDTTDDNPAPFSIQNLGNVNVNITIGSTALWTKAAATSDKYKFACGNDIATCTAESVTTLTNMTIGSSTLAIANMNWAAGNDTLQVEIGVTVPVDEPAGAKSATVTFTASAA